VGGRRRKPVPTDDQTEKPKSGHSTAMAPAGPASSTTREDKAPPRWPFMADAQTASHWVAPLALDVVQPARAPLGDTPRIVTPSSRIAPPETAQVAETVEAPTQTREAAAPDAADASPAVETAPAQAPVQTTGVQDVTPVPRVRKRSEPVKRPRRGFAVVLTVVWLAAVAVSGGRLAAAHGLWSQSDDVTRVGAVVATWLAIVMLARRCGGRYILIGLFAGAVLALATAYPENWALAGAGVTTATVHGVLGMTMSRPATGLRTLRELLISALIGAAGAVVVTGYDVVLRPFRFRVMVLTLVLLAGFALAWRLGHGARSIGRRGAVLIGCGVLVLAGSVAYTQAIRAWGSPGVIASVTDLTGWLDDNLGAVPRPIEALVGFPALMWGVATRRRRRQGWWMCAFGGLGAAGVATSLIQPATPFVESVSATGYDLLIGALLGLVLVGADSLLTGRGRRSRSDDVGVVERPEPPRFAALL
jgi:hypothetical protein